jgi:tetratricopeptide (TPR) repeat protein
MRCILQLLAGILFYNSVQAQTVNQAFTTGNTYAIIIGIAKYDDPTIDQLNFANRDAAVFANYLMSASGGSVPKENIKLLLDSAATFGEVYNAFRWVSYNCKENDRVYFYFSGHGAIENRNMFKNGYLLLYKTTAVAFAGSGFSIDLLNDEITNLSVNNKAKVIVITDACHSGKMNEKNFKGNFFVGEQLMLKKENEVRMASSKPDQLSNEKVDWGGGRGVFSYHLVNGLQGGLADSDHDKVVTVSELKKYLENKMANDPVLKNDNDVQTPVIEYKVDYKLASVVEGEAVKIQEQVKEDSVNIMKTIGSLPLISEDEDMEPDAFFLKQLKKQNLQGLTDSLRLNSLTAAEVVFAIINYLKMDSVYENSLFTLSGEARSSYGYDIKKSLLIEKSLLKISLLEKELRKDKEKLSRLNLDIAGIFLDEAQQVISNYIKGDQADYISGDEAELERRRYYNSRNEDYDVYVRMFEVTRELSKTDKYFSQRAAMFLHYFKGFVSRLKIPLTQNPGPLIEQALAEQKKALALQEYDACIYNELGVLYQFKNNLTEAEKNYVKATELSPEWAIPQSNLSRLFFYKKNYEKALMYADKADRLQNNLQSVSVNRGFIHEKQSNLLLAEEDYYQAIGINSRYFLPFERLGYVNINIANYAIADSFFYEAGLRKKGYTFQPAPPEGSSWVGGISGIARMSCSFTDTLNFKPDDMLAWFAWGIGQLYSLYTAEVDVNGAAPTVKKNNPDAMRHFKQVVALDKKNPLVYHYMARIYYEHQQWEEAELMFRYAIANYMSPKIFKKYLDSVKKGAAYPYEHSCYENIFNNYYYNQADDYYFLASLYEKWNKPYEAEACYKNVIELFPQQFRAYMKLWQLLEKQKLYTDAEYVMLNCEKYHRDTMYKELNAFYRRAIDNEPANAEWYYKLGLLLYKHAGQPSRWKENDTIKWYPKINLEMFPDEIYWTSSIDDSGHIVRIYTGRKWSDVVIDIGQGTSEKYQPQDRHERSFDTEEYSAAVRLDTLKLANEVITPRYNGILYLTKAEEMISGREKRTDIYFKIAEIYIRAGSKKRAYPYFEKSLSMMPDNSNIRIKLVDVYTALHKNTLAITQLNYLYDNSLISFDKRLQLARFNMLAGNFSKANALLNKADSIHPYVLPEIFNLHGLANMLANKPNEAIHFYENNIKQVEADKRKFRAYTLARLYAATGNSNKALQWLETAIGYGFNYSFVLQNDSHMNKLRLTQKWKTLIGSIAKKEYRKVINQEKDIDGDGLNK